MEDLEDFIGTPDDMPEYGYTSGTHTCKCCGCGQKFYGGKHAIRCQICATEYQYEE